jgi:hypothetical protein
VGRQGLSISDNPIARLREEMSHPVEGADYYSITLISPDGESVVCDVFTEWVDFAIVDGRRHEVRQAAVVQWEWAHNLYELIGREPLVVSTERQLTLFFALGGTGLIETKLAREQMPETLEPSVSVQDGLMGFRALGLIVDPLALRRAPTAKRRMAVLDRDDRRCKICGRRPDDHEDLELRVHHVRPWSHGGLTEEQNLVTLCNTCHNGLEPHFDPTLFRYSAQPQVSGDDSEYHEGVARYRALVSNTLGPERERPETP